MTQVDVTHNRVKHSQIQGAGRILAIMYNLFHYYCKTSDIRLTLLGNIVVDHSDVVGAVFILDLIPDFNGLDKDNCKMRQETFKVWDLVHLY